MSFYSRQNRKDNDGKNNITPLSRNLPLGGIYKPRHVLLDSRLGHIDKYMN